MSVALGDYLSIGLGGMLVWDTSGVTPPGPPSVGLTGYTDTTATFSNVLGTGATSTLITLTPSTGGAPIMVSGDGAYLSASGLMPNTTYHWAAQAGNGVLSVLAAGNLGTFTTRPGPLTANRIQVWWKFPYDSAWSVNAPEYIDPAQTGPQDIGGLMGLGIGRDIEVFIFCDDPVPVCRITSMFLAAQHPGPRPGGIRDELGNP